jgi:hypothetical protein
MPEQSSCLQEKAPASTLASPGPRRPSSLRSLSVKLTLPSQANSLKALALTVWSRPTVWRTSTSTDRKSPRVHVTAPLAVATFVWGSMVTDRITRLRRLGSAALAAGVASAVTSEIANSSANTAIAASMMRRLTLDIAKWSPPCSFAPTLCPYIVPDLGILAQCAKPCAKAK